MYLAFQYIALRERILARNRLQQVYQAEDGSEAEMDQTGRVVQTAEVIKTEIDPVRRVAFAFNPRMVPYSYWRSQELSLFWRALSEFGGPTLDFGCGDGSFSRGLFDHVDYGVDIDTSALQIAAEYKLYDHLLTFDQMAASLSTGSIGTVFSCSVLEHTIDIEVCLREIARVLKPGGGLYFTVPAPGFTDHMTTLSSRNFADMINRSYYHRNMFDLEHWRRLVETTGLKVERTVEFQPFAFTRKFFLISLLGNRSFGRIPGFRAWFWRRYKDQLMQDVAASITGTKNGANFFIVARKPEAGGA